MIARTDVVRHTLRIVTGQDSAKYAPNPSAPHQPPNQPAINVAAFSEEWWLKMVSIIPGCIHPYIYFFTAAFYEVVGPNFHVNPIGKLTRCHYCWLRQRGCQDLGNV